MSESNLPALWTPSPMESGTDLLPVAAVGPRDLVGQENVTGDDLILPTIKLLQGMSPEVTKQTVEGAVPGRFLHTGALECFKGPIRVLLVAYTKSRALFPNDKDPDCSGLERCLSRDGIEGDHYGMCDQCPYTQWRENKRPPLCSEARNFTVLTPFGPAIIRFSKRSTPSARNFVSTWTMSGKPMWAHPVLIGTKQHIDIVDKQGTEATNYSLEMRWLTRETVPPAAQQVAREIHEKISSANAQGKLRADDEGDDFANPPF